MGGRGRGEEGGGGRGHCNYNPDGSSYYSADVEQ